MSASGSLQELNLKGRRFAVAADADATRKLGGFENEVQANGDASVRLVKTRVPFMFSGLQIEVDDNRGDHEYLMELANSMELFAASATLVDGRVWQGVGQIVDAIEYSTQSGTATISFSGQGQLESQ